MAKVQYFWIISAILLQNWNGHCPEKAIKPEFYKLERNLGSKSSIIGVLP
jgi:hypothetical protein